MSVLAGGTASCAALLVGAWSHSWGFGAARAIVIFFVIKIAAQILGFIPYIAPSWDTASHTAELIGQGIAAACLAGVGYWLKRLLLRLYCRAPAKAPRSLSLQRIIWPDMRVERNARIGLWLGYIACGTNALAHLTDVMFTWGAINNLRATVSKLPPLNFNEFLSGNSLSTTEVALFISAIVLLGLLIVFKPIWGFALNLVWTCLNVALYIVTFFAFNSFTWVAVLVPIFKVWLAVQGLRGARNYHISTPTLSLESLQTPPN